MLSRWVGLVALAASLLGCSNPTAMNDGGCGPSVTSEIDSLPSMLPHPMHHTAAKWSRQGLIAYVDAGIVWVAPGGGAHQADTALAGIWVISPDSGTRQRVTSFGNLPSWSPGGDQLVFTTGLLSILSISSGHVQLLPIRGPSFFPSWSPDGSSLVFDSRGSDGAYRIWKSLLDGSDQHPVQGLNGPGSRCPSWSPDGGHIVHVRAASGSEKVFVMTTDGTNLIQMTHGQSRDLDPEYSPDGSMLAFSAQQRRGLDVLPQVWVMRVDGSCARQVTSLGGSHPSWSPDGRYLVYTKEDWRRNDPGFGVLWTVDLYSLEEEQLTFKWPETPPQSGFSRM